MKKDMARNLIRVGVSVALLVVIMLLSKNTKLFSAVGDVEKSITLSAGMLVNALMAIALVVLVSNILLVVLGFFREMKGRTGTLATVTSSLLKYAAVLVAF